VAVLAARPTAAADCGPAAAPAEGPIAVDQEAALEEDPTAAAAGKLPGSAGNVQEVDLAADPTDQAGAAAVASYRREEVLGVAPIAGEDARSRPGLAAGRRVVDRMTFAAE
jgi:hypothetical protein